MQIHNAEAPGSLIVGVGHPARSYLDWLVPDGLHEYGYEPTLASAAEPIAFDVYGQWHEHPPEKLRVQPATAREAAREYVRTGQRPTLVQWTAE